MAITSAIRFCFLFYNTAIKKKRSKLTFILFILTATGWRYFYIYIFSSSLDIYLAFKIAVSINASESFYFIVKMPAICVRRMKYWTSTEPIYIATEISRDGMCTRRVLWMQINCIIWIHACHTCTYAIYYVRFFFHKLLCNLFVNTPDDLFSQFFFIVLF